MCPIKRVSSPQNDYLFIYLQVLLLASVVSNRTLNVHRDFPLHKRFFIVFFYSAGAVNVEDKIVSE